MIILYVFLAIIGAIAIKSASASVPSRTPANPNNPKVPATTMQSPEFYNTGGVVGARQVSSLVKNVLSDFHLLPKIAKPQLVIAAYNPQTGTISYVTQYADTVTGVGWDGNVLFSNGVHDGPGSSSFAAGKDCQYLNVSGPGGMVIISVADFSPGLINPSTYSPSDEFVPPSSGLSNPPSVLPSVLSAGNPYPASTDSFVMPKPTQTGAMNPNNAIVSLV
jgi:hypothetical protein